MTRPAYPVSDHYDGRRFFNPGVDTDKGVADLLRWQRSRARVAWPAEVTDPPSPPPPETVAANEAAFTFIGHSTYLIQLPGVRLLTDPVFSERVSPFSFVGPKRVRRPGLSLAEVPPVDVILLSHNHYDHMDLASLRALAERDSPTIVTGLGNGRYLERRGIGPVIELDWWERRELRPDLAITYVPAQHWSSRWALDRRRMLWGGHWVEAAGGRLYFAGDTGYFPGFTQIRDRLGTPDAAILPIGAYEPRWFMRTQHMDPADAVQAHVELGAGLSLAAHWGTFQLTDEGIEAPVLALAAARRDRGVPDAAFQVPRPGETVLARLGSDTSR
ncbi:MBL fold metallo-hydrolase [Lichenihabitans sp. Uapishka_5]|uniref:MBL fold metallo-hydrolase n=1 Tax=Lichenihabitans sp. Uapishka_5 TaxID=3037302 RepID=UPI0029E7F393|nr:MBL fold metallo-hydrolase [Lichenihabitans sp. Uapishka_5]MDX7950461.1 MBL fold metallo-hydrolase [Lichenihabitans sp. Uapishka_5]